MTGDCDCSVWKIATLDTTTRSRSFSPSTLQTSTSSDFQPATETRTQRTHTQTQSDCCTPSMLQSTSTHIVERSSLSSGPPAPTPKSTETTASVASMVYQHSRTLLCWKDGSLMVGGWPLTEWPRRSSGSHLVIISRIAHWYLIETLSLMVTKYVSQQPAQ